MGTTKRVLALVKPVINYPAIVNQVSSIVRKNPSGLRAFFAALSVYAYQCIFGA